MRTNSHSIIRGFRGGKVSDKMDLTPEFARSKIEANQPFAETKNFIDVIKRAGMTDVHICDVGWESGGTDARYPQIFPIDECSGGEAGLKDYLKYAADNGYLVGAHTNHTDAYTNSDMWDSDFVCRKSDGKLLRIGVFNGGNMYYICQKCSWDKFIKKQLEQTRALGYEGVLYIDIYSARPPDPCFNPKHPATRDVQAEYQNKALSYARSLFGGVASECGFEHCLHNLDYVNYLGRDMLHGEGFGEHNKDKNSFLPDKSHYHEMVDRIAPLWEIVFHGIVPSNPDKFTQFYRPKGSTNLLRLAEFGGRPVFYSSSYKPAAVEKYKAMYDFFQPMKHLQLEFMEENKPLSDGVYLTRYGDGSRVVTNYTANDFIYDGKTVKARDYLLIAPR